MQIYNMGYVYISWGWYRNRNLWGACQCFCPRCCFSFLLSDCWEKCNVLHVALVMDLIITNTNHQCRCSMANSKNVRRYSFCSLYLWHSRYNLIDFWPVSSTDSNHPHGLGIVVYYLIMFISIWAMSFLVMLFSLGAVSLRVCIVSDVSSKKN